MKNSKKIVAIAVSVIIVLAIIIAFIKLISGAVSLVNMTFNAVLGILVIFALLVIVAWMFIYAKKHKK